MAWSTNKLNFLNSDKTIEDGAAFDPTDHVTYTFDVAANPADQNSITVITFSVQSPVTGDELFFDFDGTGLSISGNEIYSGATLIATFAGGTDGAALVITPAETGLAQQAIIEELALVANSVRFANDDTLEAYSRVIFIDQDFASGTGSLTSAIVTSVTGASTPLFGRDSDLGDMTSTPEATSATNNTSAPAGLSSGDYVVTFTKPDAGGLGVYAQRFDKDGQPLGSEFLVNTYETNNQWVPAVTGLPDGGYVIAWPSEGQDSSGYGIYFQRFDADDNPVGSETQVNTYTLGNQQYPDVAPLNDGGWIVTWSDQTQDGSGWGIYFQIYDSDGLPVGGETLANVTIAGLQVNANVSVLESGQFVITWQDSGADGSNWGVFARLFDADGTPDGGEFQVNTYTTDQQYNPNITALSGGGFAITWASYAQDEAANYGIFGQVYDADGNPVGGEFQVNQTEFSSQQNPVITATDDGGFVVVWVSPSPVGNLLYARQFDAQGHAAGDEIVLPAAPPSTTWDTSDGLATLVDGNIAISYYDSTGSTIKTFVISTATLPSFEGDEDAALPVPISLDWPDAVDGSETLQLVLSGYPAGGVFNLGADGGSGTWVIDITDVADLLTLEFTPPSGYFGDFTLTAVATTTESADSSTTGVTAEFAVTILEGGHDPVAVDDDGAAVEDSSTTGNVLTNDTDDLGHDLTVTGVSSSAGGSVAAGTDIIGTYGTLTLNSDGSYTYLANLDYLDTLSGVTGLVDSFTYTISDGDGGSDTGTLNIAVTLAADEVTTDGTGLDDTLTAPDSEQDDTMNGGDGNDAMSGMGGADWLYGGRGNDSMSGGDGMDFIYGERGNDTMSGGLGDDTMGGGRGNDTMSGDDGNDAMGGGRGKDTMSGGDGNDVLSGGGDDDTLDGGLGNDLLAGGRGNDALHGDAGSDTFYFGAVNGNDVIDDFEVGVDFIQLTQLVSVLSITSNLDGDAVLNLSLGGTVTLQGVTTDDIGDESNLYGAPHPEAVDTLLGVDFGDPIVI